jgi:ATP-dependent 26S proteasome regulatory subunit
MRHRDLEDRLEEYCAQKHHVHSIDGAVEFLQRNLPEYRRQKVGPLKKYMKQHWPAASNMHQDKLDPQMTIREPKASHGSIVTQSPNIKLSEENLKDGRQSIVTPIAQVEETVSASKKDKPEEGDSTRSDAKTRKRARHKSVEVLESRHENGPKIVLPPTVSFKDLGGIASVLDVIKKKIVWPLAFPERYARLGVKLPRGILLHGPPGSGKTMLANAIATETGVPFLKRSGTELISSIPGMAYHLSFQFS